MAQDEECLVPVRSAPYPDVLSWVSSYWRQIAIATSSLWADIRVDPEQTNCNYVALLLERSKGHPVHLTIQGDPSSDVYRLRDDLFGLFANASTQIRTLQLKYWCTSHKPPVNMLAFFLNNSLPGTLKTLRIMRLSIHAQGSSPEREWNQFSTAKSPDRRESVLASVEVLHLQDIHIPWGSTAYHGLVDLRLVFIFTHAPLEPSQFAAILTASPALNTLKIQNLSLEYHSSVYAPTTVQLPYLEVLYLNYLPADTWDILSSMISLTGCSENLSIGFKRFYPGEGVHLKNFLCDARLKTLYFNPEAGVEFTYEQILWSLQPAILNSLILDSFDPLVDYDLAKMTAELQKGKKGGLGLAYLPHLYMTFCAIRFKDLQVIIPLFGVQTLHLETCAFFEPEQMMTSRNLGTLKAKLLDMFPNLVCIISDQDTTSEWPCRKMFD